VQQPGQASGTREDLGRPATMADCKSIGASSDLEVWVQTLRSIRHIPRVLPCLAALVREPRVIQPVYCEKGQSSFHRREQDISDVFEYAMCRN
jgi:hypothetical protein